MHQDGTASPMDGGPFLAAGQLTQLLAELAAAPPESVELAPIPGVGDRLGRFLLVREIGRGGFGVVFEAEDTELRRRVALKVIRPQRAAAAKGAPGTTTAGPDTTTRDPGTTRDEPGAATRESAGWLRQEAEAAAQVRHPNIVTLYDAGTWEGGTYLVYELLRGETLAQKLESGPLSHAEARRVLRDLARALAHLHAGGVVHRDVKAANVFIDTDGTVKLLDLGIAQITGSVGEAAGSPPYAAPEQWRGERADSRADVYAWGVLAHQLLTGGLPTGPPAAGPHPPGALRALVAAARSEDPARRPSDGGALLATIDRIELRRARARMLRLAALGLAVGAIALFLAWPTEREIARSVSTSLEAYHRYSAGRRCLDRPSEGASWLRLDCARHFREALAIDPDFPLAHYELAALARWDSHPTGTIEEVLEPALRRIDRLPPREQAQLRAWKAELDGDFATAVVILTRLAEEHPDDAHVALALGEAFYRQARHADAVAPLERAVTLDPGLELASDELVWSLGFLDRTEDLRRLAERMASSPPSAGTYHAEVLARGWIGDTDGALRVARRAAVGDGGAAREDLEDALVAAGQWEEAEAMIRQDGARGLERAPHRLESLLILRGRMREAREWVARQPIPADARLRFIAGSRRAHRLAADRDAAAIERIVDETQAWSAESAASFAPVLAYAGAVERAEALLPDVTTGDPGVREITGAIASWRRAGPRAALEQLRGFAGADPSAVPALPPEGPAWLAAECAVESGDGEAALEDVRRFQRFYFPLGLWRAWAYPRSLVMEARLLAALGRPAEAAAALDRLEVLWASADPELPLLAEARELRRRLTGGRHELDSGLR